MKSIALILITALTMAIMFYTGYNDGYNNGYNTRVAEEIANVIHCDKEGCNL